MNTSLDTSFNFVTLVESDPMSRLVANNNNNRLLQKLRETFTEFQQQLYAAFQHCHDNYDLTNDYIIDLDHVWEWLGFSQKSRAKVLLEKNFDLGSDYKMTNTVSREQNGNSRGGHNKQVFLMNLETFKCLCLKAKTPRARIIQDYYIKVQNNLFAFSLEEHDELRRRSQEMREHTNELRRQLQERNERYDELCRRAQEIDDDESSIVTESSPVSVQSPTTTTPQNMEQYPHTIDELVIILNADKWVIIRFVQRHFKINFHFIKVPCPRESPNGESRGGQNRIDVRLTEECYNLVRNSYNWRNRNITDTIGNTQLVSVIQPIETQTINFIENCFKSTLEMHRQFHFGRYRVDLFIRDYGIVVECDEFNHRYIDTEEEFTRELFIYSHGINKIIRYNPNEEGFCISEVIDRIYSEISFINGRRIRQQTIPTSISTPITPYSMEISTQTDYNPSISATASMILDDRAFIDNVDAFLEEHCCFHDDYKVTAKELIDKYVSVTGETNRAVLRAVEDHLQRAHFIPYIVIERRPLYTIMGFSGLKLR
jgi:very-short-patch-repair endonuclease